jgi:TetR/AcrR family transcriptional repressor of nem operon
MGRGLEFHDQDALKKAMHLFWEKGYEHCSLSDLLEKMGIGSSSFYNTFGNKKKLFLKTLQLYNDDLNQRLELLLLSSLPFKNKIRAIFAASIDRQLATDVPKGCFLINSVSADALEDKDIYWVIRGYLDRFEQVLEEAIRQAMGSGELGNTFDPPLTAAVLNVYLQGLMKMSLLSYPTSKLHQQTEVFLKSLGF